MARLPIHTFLTFTALPLLLLGALHSGITTARAAAFTMDLTSLSYWDRGASTGIWDPAGRLWAQVAPGGSSSQQISFGDGSDGAFQDGPPQTGISVNGDVITVNSDLKALYQFTSFQLSSGKTLVATGTQALVFRVSGNTTIAGVFTANGTNGANASAGSGIGPQPGGAGGPAGGVGGNGAAKTGGGGLTSGSPGTGNIEGGGAAAGSQGGGGGCYGVNGGADAANDSQSGNPAAGNFGDCAVGAPQSRPDIAAAFETVFQGGGGGGGGGFSAGNAAGGGGGGGGGAVRISSLGKIVISGSLQAAGGNGGLFDTTAAGQCGGGGGGGSGGALWLQTLGTVSGSGTISVAPGAGGTSPFCGNSNSGGAGSRGTIRFDTLSGGQSVTAISPATVPASNDPGLAVSPPSGQSTRVVSKALDFSKGILTFGAPQETIDSSGLNGCGTTGSVSLIYEGSMDGLNFSHPVSASGFSELSDFPYIRFKATIATTGTTPPCLTGLSFPYELKQLSDLSLKGGLACSLTETPGNRPQGGPLSQAGDLLSLGGAFLLAQALRRRKAAPA